MFLPSLSALSAYKTLAEISIPHVLFSHTTLRSTWHKHFGSEFVKKWCNNYVFDHEEFNCQPADATLPIFFLCPMQGDVMPIHTAGLGGSPECLMLCVRAGAQLDDKTTVSLSWLSVKSEKKNLLLNKQRAFLDVHVQEEELDKTVLSYDWPKGNETSNNSTHSSFLYDIWTTPVIPQWSKRQWYAESYFHDFFFIVVGRTDRSSLCSRRSSRSSQASDQLWSWC